MDLYICSSIWFQVCYLSTRITLALPYACIFWLVYSHMPFLCQYSGDCGSICYVAANVELSCPAVQAFTFFFPFFFAYLTSLPVHV
jgi:hypothetical protein